MWLKLLKSKIHRATVTETNIDYEGSITIDEQIARKANLLPFEAVLVADINNGTRHETYVIYGEPGSGTICVNGAAARLVNPGDKVIIMAFAYLQPDEVQDHTATVLTMGEDNRIEQVKTEPVVARTPQTT